MNFRRIQPRCADACERSWSRGVSVAQKRIQIEDQLKERDDTMAQFGHANH